MPNYSMDEDAAFWQAPGRFSVLDAKSPLINTRASWFPMGDVNNDGTPVAMVFKMEPGYVITRHAHPCHRFEVVVRGSIDTGDRVLVPGDVMISEPNEFYGPKTAGKDGCTTIEIFSTAIGAVSRMVEGEDGTVQTVNLVEQFEVGFKHLLST